MLLHGIYLHGYWWVLIYLQLPKNEKFNLSAMNTIQLGLGTHVFNFDTGEAEEDIFLCIRGQVGLFSKFQDFFQKLMDTLG